MTTTPHPDQIDALHRLAELASGIRNDESLPGWMQVIAVIICDRAEYIVEVPAVFDVRDASELIAVAWALTESLELLREVRAAEFAQITPPSSTGPATVSGVEHRDASALLAAASCGEVPRGGVEPSRTS